jgi:hypothetical protein
LSSLKKQALLRGGSGSLQGFRAIGARASDSARFVASHIDAELLHMKIAEESGRRVEHCKATDAAARRCQETLSARWGGSTDCGNAEPTTSQAEDPELPYGGCRTQLPQAVLRDRLKGFRTFYRSIDHGG